MLLKACLNGARPPHDHPRLPASPGQLADDVVAVAAAGADAVHLHVKDPRSGNDTLDPTITSEALAAVRAAAPGMPIGLTTGAWAEPNPERRARTITGWTTVPDFASVNWHEDGADQVAEILLDLGVAVEAGLWHPSAVRAWLGSPLRDRCRRVLLELPEERGEPDSVANADELLDLCRPAVDSTGLELVLHGEGSSCWPVLRHAVRLGLGTRVGLEDTVTMPDGDSAPSNAALVSAARALIDAAGSRRAQSPIDRS